MAVPTFKIKTFRTIEELIAFVRTDLNLAVIHEIENGDTGAWTIFYSE